MSFLGTEDLKKVLPECIEGYDERRIDNVAYELCLGGEAYLTDSDSGKKEILDDKNTQVVIRAGQFALLITLEKVKIPKAYVAFISIKFSQKIKGLVNVSGFHVDPGFDGKVIFSVYNAGPSDIVLDKGKPYFMMWLSQLTSDSEPYDGKHKGQVEITGEQIAAIKGKLASPNFLLERVNSNDQKLERIFWAAGILIGISITIAIKSWSDSSKIKEAYEYGLKEKTAKEEVSNAISKTFFDSTVLTKVDSILGREKKASNNTTDITLDSVIMKKIDSLLQLKNARGTPSK